MAVRRIPFLRKKPLGVALPKNPYIHFFKEIMPIEPI